jgi:hypothetical protein
MQISYYWGCTIHRLKGMVMFNCVKCKQSFFGYVCPHRLLFPWWNKTLLSDCSSYCLQQSIFCFLLCCSTSNRPPCSIENSDLHMVQNTFPACWSSFINGYSAFRFLVKTHFLFRIFMGFLFPAVHISKHSRSYNDYTPHKLNQQCDARQQKKLDLNI